MGFRLNIRTFVGVGLALVVGVAACGLSVLGDSATAAANVFLDGQGHLVIEARRASADLNCWYERCEYSSGKVTTEVSSYELLRAVPPSDTTQIVLEPASRMDLSALQSAVGALRLSPRGTLTRAEFLQVATDYLKSRVPYPKALSVSRTEMPAAIPAVAPG